MHNFASDSIADEPHSKTDPSQDYVNAPKFNRRTAADAPIEADKTSNSSPDLNI